MTLLMRVVMRLYPAGWRRRYGAELEQLIRDSGLTWGAAIDVARAGLALRAMEAAQIARALARAPLATGAWLPHLRRLRAAPAFTLTIVATLALAIGANVAIFSLVNAAILKPLPFAEEDRLMALWHVAPGMAPGPLNQAAFTYFTYRDEARAFEDIALWAPQTVSVTGTNDPAEIEALAVTEGFLPVLRVSPAAGRFFAKDDDRPGARATVVIGHDFWTRALGGTVQALGRTLDIDGRPHEIIGVLPAGFRMLRHAPQALLPLRLDRATTQVGLFRYQGVGRLKAGVTREAAAADLARLVPSMPERFPIPQGFSRKMFDDFRLAPEIHPLRDDIAGGARRTLWVLLGAVLLLMAVACANGASLFLVRGELRRQELGVQMALGAGLPRIAGQILGEAIIVTGLGGGLGLALGFAGLRALTSFLPTAVPFANAVTMDWITAVFACALSLGAGLVFCIGPLAGHLREDFSSLLRGGRNPGDAPRRQRTWNTLVVAQVSLTLVLLVGSGLLIRSLWLLRDVPPGFQDPRRVLTARIAIPEAIVADPFSTAGAHRTILERIGEIRGVEAAGQASTVTMEGVMRRDPLFAEGVNDADGAMPPLRRMKWATPGYFGAVRNPFAAGRDFRWEDVLEARDVGIVTLNLAKELFGSAQGAIGRRIRPAGRGPWREIVGVVGDEHDDGPARPPTPTVYWPTVQRDYVPLRTSVERSLVYTIRTSRANDPALLGEIQAAVWSVLPAVPVSRVETLEAIVSRNLSQLSLVLSVLAIAASVTLAIGMVGLYGVVASLVTHRRREIAIRLAVGAATSAVGRLFLRRGLTIVGAGLSLGVVGSVALSRTLGGLLFGVGPLDPFTYGAAVALLGLVGTAAVWIPAWSATRVPPATVLRG